MRCRSRLRLSERRDPDDVVGLGFRATASASSTARSVGWPFCFSVISEKATSCAP